MFEIYNEYNNFRQVEYSRASSCKEVDDLVSYLVSDAGYRKASGYMINMKLILLELYFTYNEDTTQYLAYYRNRKYYSSLSKVSDGSKRYGNSVNITATYFINSVEYLINENLVSYKVGGRFRKDETGNEYYAFLSRIRATDRLVSLWNDYKWQPNMLTLSKPEGLIRLKSVTMKTVNKYGRTVKYNKLIGYRDNKTSRAMRRIVEAYNNHISKYRIECACTALSDEDKAKLVAKLVRQKNKWLKRRRGSDAPVEDYQPKIIIKLSQVRTYRVFNNADTTFTQGGRWYGNWWVNCPSILRKYITIDGDPTVELDFSGMHIHLLYALEGINYAVKGEDPYILEDGIGDRKLNKLILLTALNVIKEESSSRAVYTALRDSGDLDDYNLKHPIVTIRNKLSLLKDKHPSIASKIANGWGTQLQYHDSQIIEKLIVYCLSCDIPILTIHDSVVIKARFVNIIKHKMLSLYAEYISNNTVCKLEYNLLEHCSDVFLTAITSRLEPDKRIPIEYALYNPILDKLSIEDNYLSKIIRPKPIIKIDIENTQLSIVKDKNHSSGSNTKTITLTLDHNENLVLNT